MSTAKQTAQITPAHEHETTLRTVRPKVDVFVSDTRYQIIGDFPGVAPEDFDVRLETDTVLLTGLGRKDGDPWIRYERSFRIPRFIDVENLEARLDAGVLTLTLPKADHARVRRIPVEVG